MRQEGKLRPGPLLREVWPPVLQSGPDSSMSGSDTFFTILSSNGNSVPYGISRPDHEIALWEVIADTIDAWKAEDQT